MINSHVIYNDNLEAILEGMEKSGMARAVLAALPAGACIDGACIGDTNEKILEAIKKYPDKFIGCGYINPLDNNAEELADKLYYEGFKAVKLYPADGYYPDDRKQYGLYAKLEEKGMVVYFHMGLADYCCKTEKGSRKAPNSSFAYPMKLDPICRLFPGINFVVVNMGYPLMIEAWSVHHNSSNIYLHLGGDGISFTAPGTAYCSLGGPGFIPLDCGRIIFGSGKSKDMVKSKILAEDSFLRMGFKEKQVQNIFEINPGKLFRI